VIAASAAAPEGTARTSARVATAMSRRGRSAASERAIPSTPPATTTTATSFSPWIAARNSAEPSGGARLANANISSAAGAVKARKAASAPRQPARSSPIAKPIWLLAGPGRNWHRASNCA